MTKARPKSLFDHMVLAYAFRVFFILGAGYAALGVLIWAGFWYGLVSLPQHIAASQWHAHEMLFGFAGAALCGFLMTAVPSWTDTAPRRGRDLALLVALWLLARLLMLGLGLAPVWLAGAINLGFMGLLAAWTLPQLWQDRLKRHRSLVLFLAALLVAQVLVYAGWLGFEGLGPDLAWRAINLGLYLFLAAISLVVTRMSMVLVPLALEELDDEESEFRPLPPRRNLAAATLVLFALVDFVAPGHAVSGWIALAAAAAQLDRMADWHVGRVLLRPYVLMLYLVHVWLVIGLAGLGFDALFGWDVFSAARHALSLGSVGLAVLTVFIITGLRHTGREVVLPGGALAALALINGATALRVGVPLISPDHIQHAAVGLASVLWAAAFGAYLWSFYPMLVAPRVDGKPG